MQRLHRTTRLILCIAMSPAVILSACARQRPDAAVVPSAAPRNSPDWVNRGSGAFSDAGRVFYGVGLVAGMRNPALARETADARARTEVARILTSYISSLMRDYQASTSDLQRSEEQQLVEAATRAFTDVNLTGATIVNHWQDPSTGTLYALARLDLAATSESLSGVNELSARMRDYIRTNAERAFDRLEAARSEQRPPQR